MTIWEAYEQYRTMPNLRLHQLRVAAVARVLANFKEIDPEPVTKAALLHDMGNILKADLTLFPPEFYGNFGQDYWESVKADFVNLYGASEHDATRAIAQEIGVEQRVIDIIDSIGFSKAAEIYEHGALDVQIVEYADQRVAPDGITSMTARLREGKLRFHKRHHDAAYHDDELFEKNLETLYLLEERLFEGINTTPEEFTEDALKHTIEELRSYKIA